MWFSNLSICYGNHKSQKRTIKHKKWIILKSDWNHRSILQSLNVCIYVYIYIIFINEFAQQHSQKMDSTIYLRPQHGEFWVPWRSASPNIPWQSPGVEHLSAPHLGFGNKVPHRHPPAKKNQRDTACLFGVAVDHWMVAKVCNWTFLIWIFEA